MPVDYGPRHREVLQDVANATSDADGPTFRVDGAPSAPAGLIGRVRLSASAGGAPTLDAVIEDSWDGVNWSPLITFSQLTALAEETLAASRAPAPFIRSSADVAGTSPDVDFRVDLLGAKLTAD